MILFPNYRPICSYLALLSTLSGWNGGIKELIKLKGKPLLLDAMERKTESLDGDRYMPLSDLEAF